MAAGTSDFPTSLDTTTNLPAASTLATAELDGDGNANVQHSNLHGTVDTAVVQLETKLGTGSSTPGAAGKLLRASSATASAWSTLTFPDTAAISTIIYASAADTLAALATANNGVLVTSGTGVPSISSTLPSFTTTTITTTGSIELGHASDTTISRVSAGVVSIEGVSIATASNTLTLTNKTLTSPTIGTSPTAAGATWTDLGSVTTVDINGGTLATVTVDGALTSSGGSLAGTWAGTPTFSGATVTFSGGTASTSVSTGTIVISGAGGLGVGGNIRAGASIVSGPHANTSFVADTAAAGLFGYIAIQRSGVTKWYLGSNASDEFSILSSAAVANVTVTDAGITKILASTASTSTTTGALVVTGGVGIGAAINAGGKLTTTVNVTVEGPVNVPVATAAPTTPLDGDFWISDIAGARKLNARISGVTYSVAIT